jgi:hypothetical protein
MLPTENSHKTTKKMGIDCFCGSSLQATRERFGVLICECFIWVWCDLVSCRTLNRATRRLQKIRLRPFPRPHFVMLHMSKTIAVLILSFPPFVYRVVSEGTRRYTRRDIMVEVIILSAIGVLILGSISNAFTKK